jgi:hypothetical protein
MGKCSETTAEKWKKEREEDEKWENDYAEVGRQERAKKITEDQATKMKNALNEEKKKRDEKRSGEKKKVSRWIYVNNIPDGSIPFISNSADGQTMDDLRGLIPGALGNLGALNPVQLFNGFTAGTYPDCAEVTLQTVNNNNVRNRETRHIALVEMVEMNPCHFPNGRNPASGKTCPPDKRIEGLTSMGNLAGSSGVAYQTSHRSPLSYNIGGSATKSSPMTGLSFDKFERKRGDGVDSAVDERLDAKEIIERHNNNVGTFYSGMRPAEYTTTSDNAQLDAPAGASGSSGLSLYDEMIEKLAQLIEPNEDNRNGDLSDIRGDTLSQVYYYSLTAILLYILYRFLYTKK